MNHGNELQLGGEAAEKQGTKANGGRGAASILPPLHCGGVNGSAREPSRREGHEKEAL